MAYFSNGTEGMIWEERNCRGCVHDVDPDTGSCPVLTAHYFFNREQHDNESVRNLLSLFVPRSEDGLSNETCAMRHEAGEG